MYKARTPRAAVRSTVLQQSESSSARELELTKVRSVIESVNDGAVQGRGVAVVHKLSVRHPLSFSQRSSVTVYRQRPPGPPVA